ncbi:MAG: hypothetical protein JSS43_21130, partial [Proteobacteria bacterium]|nr:hypothetical protein [Pseudomonadota bacterium]
MGEPSIAVQALSPAGQARAKEVWGFQRAMSKLSRATHTGIRWGFLAISVIAVVEAGALYHLMPLVRVVPVFIPLQADNTLAASVTPMQVDPSVTMDSLKNSPAAISAALWQYVRLRESYNWAEANYSWDVVSAMSSIGVRKQFQDWFVYTNKQSPQVAYGFKGAIKLSWVESRLDGDKFTVTFWRQQFDDGNPVSKPQQWTCNLSFATDYATPPQQRLQFNPSGLVV